MYLHIYLNFFNTIWPLAIASYNDSVQRSDEIGIFKLLRLFNVAAVVSVMNVYFCLVIL